MQFTKAADSYLLRLETDEEIIEALGRFAQDRRIDTGTVLGIGSLYDAVLGYYDRTSKEYLRRSVEGDCEIVSLIGNITLKDGLPFPHVHVTLGTRAFEAIAGHLFQGKVAATCELVVRPLPGVIQRRKDARSGLFLMDV